jgi:hypothetical protein
LREPLRLAQDGVRRLSQLYRHSNRVVAVRGRHGTLRSSSAVNAPERFRIEHFVVERCSCASCAFSALVSKSSRGQAVNA